MGSQLSIALRGVASRVENISEEEVKDLLHDGDVSGYSPLLASRILRGNSSSTSPNDVGPKYPRHGNKHTVAQGNESTNLYRR